MNDRLHKSIYGQTLDEMKEDKGAWEYEQDKPKNTLDDLWKNIKKWEIESHIDTLRNIIKVSDRSDCGIKEIDGTDEEAIMFAINALEQMVEQEPYICDTCKHKDDEWDEEPCDSCCGNHSGYEPSGDLISRQAVLEMAYDMSEIDGEHFTEPCMVVDVEDIQKLPPVNPQPKTGQYEKHIDHTDCIWYGSDSGCPVTCSQYRDGWNDAMDYIFKNGKGYQPYRHDG